MATFKNICWWACFIALAVCVQAMAPGLDVLVVGLIILLQERDYKDMLWLLPLFILLQEGMGTRPFGAAVVWYAATVVVFMLGRWLFEVGNFIFVFLLGLPWLRLLRGGLAYGAIAESGIQCSGYTG